eukprot:6011300-Prymnesium_polylepis.1
MSPQAMQRILGQNNLQPRAVQSRLPTRTRLSPNTSASIAITLISAGIRALSQTTRTSKYTPTLASGL